MPLLLEDCSIGPEPKEETGFEGFEAWDLGVFSSIEPAVSFEPHCSQKLLDGGFLAPHLLHNFASAIRKLLGYGMDGQKNKRNKCGKN
jgi:hypothetical protein